MVNVGGGRWADELEAEEGDEAGGCRPCTDAASLWAAVLGGGGESTPRMAIEPEVAPVVPSDPSDTVPSDLRDLFELSSGALGDGPRLRDDDPTGPARRLPPLPELSTRVLPSGPSVAKKGVDAGEDGPLELVGCPSGGWDGELGPDGLVVEMMAGPNVFLTVLMILLNPMDIIWFTEPGSSSSPYGLKLYSSGGVRGRTTGEGGPFDRRFGGGRPRRAGTRAWSTSSHTRRAEDDDGASVAIVNQERGRGCADELWVDVVGELELSSRSSPAKAIASVGRVYHTRHHTFAQNRNGVNLVAQTPTSIFARRDHCLFF